VDSPRAEQDLTPLSLSLLSMTPHPSGSSADSQLTARWEWLVLSTLREFYFIYYYYSCYLSEGLTVSRSSGNTLDAFSTAAKSVNTTVATTGVRGGIVEDASKVGSSPSTTSSSGAPASPTSSKPGAGVEARGSIQWGLLVLTGLVAAGFGGLII